MKKIVLTAVVMAAFTTPVFAHQCPSLMGKIDAAMKTTTVDEATKTKIMDLYAKGSAEHKAGDHDGAEADLKAALKLLGK